MTTEIKSTETARIRALNDELRKDFSQGHAVMTMGIAALGGEAVARIVKTIEVHDDFCHENDPYEEHDFGSFEAEATRSFSRSISVAQQLPSSTSRKTNGPECIGDLFQTRRYTDPVALILPVRCTWASQGLAAEVGRYSARVL